MNVIIRCARHDTREGFFNSCEICYSERILIKLLGILIEFLYCKNRHSKEFNYLLKWFSCPVDNSADKYTL